MVATEAKAAWRYARDEMNDYVRENTCNEVTETLGVCLTKMREISGDLPKMIMESDDFTNLWCRLANRCDSLNEFVFLFEHLTTVLTKIETSNENLKKSKRRI